MINSYYFPSIEQYKYSLYSYMYTAGLYIGPIHVTVTDIYLAPFILCWLYYWLGQHAVYCIKGIVVQRWLLHLHQTYPKDLWLKSSVSCGYDDLIWASQTYFHTVCVGTSMWHGIYSIGCNLKLADHESRCTVTSGLYIIIPIIGEC